MVSRLGERGSHIGSPRRAWTLLDADLAASAAFGHALGGFEAVKVVAVDAAVADADALDQRGAVRHVDRRQPPGDRQRRAGQERKAEPLRVVDHLRAAVPGRREMLVVEDRHAAAARLEDLDDLLEELVARVERLALLVSRIVAVLADDDDAIDGQAPAAERQGLGDRRVELQVVPLRRARGPGRLRGIDRCRRDATSTSGAMPVAVPAVAQRQAIEKVLGVRVRADLGAEEGDLLPPGRRDAPSGRRRPWRCRPQEGPPRKF